MSQARSSLQVFGDTDFDATSVARKDKGELGMNWRRSREGFLEEVASKQRSGPGEVEESRRTHVQRRKADALVLWEVDAVP